MARHTRRLPRDRQARAQANERAAKLLEQLGQQAQEMRELEAAARRARADLQRRVLQHIDAHELDITDMAEATGISRQSIHRLVRARNHRPESIPAPGPEPTPDWVAGRRLAHAYFGAGTIEAVDGPNLSIRFDSGKLIELHARLANIEPL